MYRDDSILLSDFEMAKQGWTIDYDGDETPAVFLFTAVYGGSVNPAQGPEVTRYMALKSGVPHPLPAIRHITSNPSGKQSDKRLTVRKNLFNFFGLYNLSFFLL